MGHDAATTWSRRQFGTVAGELARRVVRALAASHRSGREAQAASGMTKKHPFGSVWSTRFDNLVAELRELPGADVVPVPGAGYALVRVCGTLLVPFRLGTSTPARLADATIESQVLREVTAAAVPRPAPPLTLFELDDEVREDAREPVIGPLTPVVFVGVVANAESPTILEVWWGLGQSLSAEGRLTWAPERLPVELADAPGPFVPEARLPRRGADSADAHRSGSAD